jgi:antitoxin HicB
MKILNFKILLKKEPEGGFTVFVPSLPGCITYGDTVDESIINAKEAIELYIGSLKAHGEEIPNEEDMLEYTLTVNEHSGPTCFNFCQDYQNIKGMNFSNTICIVRILTY